MQYLKNLVNKQWRGIEDSAPFVTVNNNVLSDPNELYSTITFNYPSLMPVGALRVKNEKLDYTLTQTPWEKLLIDVSLLVGGRNKDTIDYKVKLHFKNQAHLSTQVNSRYVYEILFQVEVQHFFRSKSYLVQLFTDRQERVSSEIQFAATKKQFKSFDETELIKALHIGIRRFRKDEGGNFVRIQESNVQLAKKMRQGLYSDVTLLCADDKIVPAHKEVLAESSLVFSAMFDNRKAEEQVDVVTIDEFDSEIVNQMLNFIYFGRINCNMETMAMELYAIAQKYQVRGLVSESRDCMMFNVKMPDIKKMFELERIFNDDELAQRTKTYIINNSALH